VRFLDISTEVHLHSSFLFSPDTYNCAFSPYRSIPHSYPFGTEGRFVGFACTTPTMDHPSSYLQHSISKFSFFIDSEHTIADQRSRELVFHITFPWQAQEAFQPKKLRRNHDAQN
jgi:hypothetical protein